MRKSIVRNYLLLSVGFGVLIGAIFPFFTLLFVDCFKSSAVFALFFGACIAAGVSVGLVSYFIGKKTVLSFIHVFSGEIEKLAGGNLETNLDYTSNDVIGEASKNYQLVVNRLTGVIYSVSGTTDFIVNFTVKLQDMIEKYLEYTAKQKESAEGLNNFMKVLLGETDAIRNDTGKEFEIVMTLVERISELSVTIKNTSAAISRSLELIANTNMLRERGEESIKLMEASMDSISQRSGQVKGIVQIIHDISEQINLLSLNAAIESARAGESGRGFAVVADEISKLADMTSSSVMDIERLITQNESEINKGLENFSNSSDSINLIMKEIRSIDEIMSEIHSSMETQLEQNYEVSRESETVKVVANNIRDTIAEHNMTVNFASKQLSKINESIAEINERAEEINESIATISTQSTDLKKAIQFFSIDDDDIM